MLEALLETARDQTVRGAPCVLALILRSDGSTPRGEGSAMLVLADEQRGIALTKDEVLFRQLEGFLSWEEEP